MRGLVVASTGCNERFRVVAHNAGHKMSLGHYTVVHGNTLWRIMLCIITATAGISYASYRANRDVVRDQSLAIYPMSTGAVAG